MTDAFMAGLTVACFTLGFLLPFLIMAAIAEVWKETKENK